MHLYKYLMYWLALGAFALIPQHAFADGVADRLKAEQQVYLAAFKYHFPSGKEGDRIMIRKETAKDTIINLATDHDVEYLKRNMPALLPETITDFLAQNEQSVNLSDAIRNKSAMLVSSTTISLIFQGNGGGWGQFYRLFPGYDGYFSLSRPGFNHSLTQSLIFVEDNCGARCGSGTYVLFKKKRGSWYPAEYGLSWIS